MKIMMTVDIQIIYFIDLEQRLSIIFIFLHRLKSVEQKNLAVYTWSFILTPKNDSPCTYVGISYSNSVMMNV